MKKHEKVLAQIDKWNAAYPPGTEVLLRDNSGTLVSTKTRSVAWGLGTTDKPHTAVVLVEGKSGGWELDRIRATLQTVSLVGIASSSDKLPKQAP